MVLNVFVVVNSETSLMPCSIPVSSTESYFPLPASVLLQIYVRRTLSGFVRRILLTISKCVANFPDTYLIFLMRSGKDMAYIADFGEEIYMH